MLVSLGGMGRIGGGLSRANGASLSVVINPTTGFTSTGGGTVTPSATDVSVTYATTTTAARFSHPVTIGQRYRLTWTQTGSASAQTAFGTSSGGIQYRPALTPVQGTTFDFTATATTLWITAQRTTAGTTVFSNFTIAPIAEVAWVDITPSKINKAGWSVSAGITVDANTGAITIPATGTSLSARQEITGLTQGVNYRLRWVNNSNSTMALLGTSNGGGQMKSAVSSDAVGSRTYEFVAQGATFTYVQFQRSTSGTAVVSDIEFQQVAT